MRRFWAWYDTNRLSGLWRLLLLLLFVTVVFGQFVMPRITSVEPASGKVGDELTALGENLGKAYAAELYLTDGTTDFKVAITDQTATAIKFKIPSEVKPGRYSLMTLTRRVPQPLEVVQPVKVTVIAGARESKQP